MVQVTLAVGGAVFYGCTLEGPDCGSYSAIKKRQRLKQSHVGTTPFVLNEDVGCRPGPITSTVGDNTSVSGSAVLLS